MPTYNRAWCIKIAIQGILDQTFKDFEFLIIDDGSEDLTDKIIANYKDERIKYVSLDKHYGLVHALSVGNEMAQGEIIVKQDSDDISFPNRLEVIDREIKDNDFFYHSIYRVWQEEGDVDVVRRDFIEAKPITDEILKVDYIPGAFAYTKKFIAETPYRDLICSEDWMLILDAYLKKKKIGFSTEALYDLCLRPDSNSVIHEQNKDYLKDKEKMEEILRSEYGINNFKYGFRNKNIVGDANVQ